MNADVKTKWLAALRGGTFTQGRRFLKVVEDGQTVHCCLGVLCELFAQETKAGEWKPDPDDAAIQIFHPASVDAIPDSAILPRAVADWAGLEFRNPDVQQSPGSDITVSLANLNDAGKSFEEIADRIEQNL